MITSSNLDRLQQIHCAILECYMLDVAAQVHVTKIIDDVQDTPALYRHRVKQCVNRLETLLSRPYNELKRYIKMRGGDYHKKLGVLTDMGMNFEAAITPYTYKLSQTIYEKLANRGFRIKTLSNLFMAQSLLILAQTYEQVCRERYPQAHIQGDSGTIWDSLSLQPCATYITPVSNAIARKYGLAQEDMDAVSESTEYNDALQRIVEQFENPDFMFPIIENTPNAGVLFTKVEKTA